MGANRLENFEVEIVKRDSIKNAEYNPRKISKEAEKKLRSFIKNNGLWSPLIVNKATMALVSGHQRINIMDSILRKKDYDITISFVNVDQETEIKGNVFMNNPSAMGEWDTDLLVEIKEIFPEVDFITDLGFNQIDLDYIFSGTDNFEQISGTFQETDSQKAVMSDIEKIEQIENLKKAKREHKARMKSDNNTGETRAIEKDDYMVTFTFQNNAEKADFMQRIKQPVKERYLRASILWDINEGKYSLFGDRKSVLTGNSRERQ